MANARTLCIPIFMFLVLLQSRVLCYQLKVGGLSGWGIPASSNPKVYTNWAKYNIPKIGDSLFFLYPPTQDSVIQVTPESYMRCNLKDPILSMNNGNSLFNITSAADFYFTSGKPGHCQKGQKIHISLTGNGDPPAYSPSSSMSDTAAAPSYTNKFGSIPAASSASSIAFSGPLVGFMIWALFF